MKDSIGAAEHISALTAAADAEVGMLNDLFKKCTPDEKDEKEEK